MKRIIIFYVMCIIATVNTQQITVDLLEDQCRNLTIENVTENEEINTCNPVYCNESNVCTHNESDGCIAVTSNNSNSQHHIKVRNKASAILFQLSLTNQSCIIEGHLIVELYEDQQRTEIWKFLPGLKIKRKAYTSLQSELTIHIKAEGSWRDMIFTYEELQFEIHIEDITKDSGLLEAKSQRANTVILYRLTPLPDRWNESSVMITIDKMSLEEVAGEYLLIGSGTEPFKGPPAVFVTGIISKPEKYYVVTDDAYISVLYRSSNQKSRLKISWKRSGNRLQDPKEDIEVTSISDAVLQAVQICFYNSSIIQEFNCTVCNEDPLPKFRSKLAELATDYVREKHLRHEIKPKHVKLFRVSSILISEDYPSGVLYVMVTIVQEYEKKSAVFRRHQMQEILERYYNYDKMNNHILLGFKVGKCPRSANYYWWFAAMAILLLFCILLSAGIWISTHNTMWKSKKKTKENKTESVSDASQLNSEAEINDNWILRKRSIESKGTLTGHKRIWMEWKTADGHTDQEPMSPVENIESSYFEQSINNEDEDTYV